MRRGFFLVLTAAALVSLARTPLPAQMLARLQPLAEVYLHSANLRFDFGPRGDVTYVYVFSITAFFILLIACFNFMNLATARSMQRAREVGMRKVIGAQRGQLIRQFLGESVLLALASLALAVALMQAKKPSPTWEIFAVLSRSWNSIWPVLPQLGVSRRLFSPNMTVLTVSMP